MSWSRARPRLLVIVAGGLLSACQSGTKPGTQLGAIHYTAEVRNGVSAELSLGDPIGETETAAWVVTYDPGEGPLLQRWRPAKLRVEVDHGPVAIVGGGAEDPKQWAVPQDVRVSVVDSGNFDVEVSCEEAMDEYGSGTIVAMQGDEVVEFKEGVSRRCTANLVYRGSNAMFDFLAYGDGEVIGRTSFGESVEVDEAE